MLGRRVACNQHVGRLRRFPLFMIANIHTIQVIATLLRLEVYLPNEMILLAPRTVRRAMFFLGRGRVQLVHYTTGRKDGLAFEVLCSNGSDGRLARGYFGELNLFVEQGYAMTARSLTHVDAYALEREDFERALRDMPTMAVREIEEAAYRTDFHEGRDFRHIVAMKIRKAAQLGGRWRAPNKVAARLKELARLAKEGIEMQPVAAPAAAPALRRPRLSREGPGRSSGRRPSDEPPGDRTSHSSHADALEMHERLNAIETTISELTSAAQRSASALETLISLRNEELNGGEERDMEQYMDTNGATPTYSAAVRPVPRLPVSLRSIRPGARLRAKRGKGSSSPDAVFL